MRTISNVLIRTRLKTVCLIALAFGGCECDDELARLEGSILVEPSAVDFGRVAVGTAATRSIRFENVGSFSLDLSGFETAAPFTSASNETSLRPGETLDLEVTFSPRQTGPAQGTLTVQTTDPEAPTLTIPLGGEGIEASVLVDPLVLDFGDVLRAGATPERRSVTITNRGSDAFDLTEAQLTNDGGGVFGLEPGNLPRSFGANASGVVMVTYLPTDLSQHSGTLRFVTTAPDGSEIVVQLLGRGVGPKMEVCSISHDMSELCTDRGDTPRLNLGGVGVGERGTGRIRVRNVGDRELRVELSAVGMGSPELSFSPDLSTIAPFGVMPGDQWVLEGAYVPTDFRADAVNLAFSSDDPDRRTQVVLVEGAVPKPIATAIPQRLTFRLSGGGANETFAFIRLVNCGSRPLRVEAAPILIQSGDAFRIRNPITVGTQIMPGDCTQTAPGAEMEVVFAPPGAGAFQASIEIRTNDPLTPVVIVEASGTRN